MDELQTGAAAGAVTAGARAAKKRHASSVPFSHRGPFTDANVTRTVLPNGLTVLVHHDPASRVAAIVTYVKVGYFDEPDDVVGVAHVVEHMFFKGTPTFGVGEIAQATKATGGYLNAHTIYDHTSYYVVLPARAFARGLEIQADAYARSLIDAGELGRELEVIIQEAKRKADNPPAVATETLYEVLHDLHRIRRWRIGREPGLRALTRDTVHAFYRSFYRPSNTILVIAGGVDPDTAMREVALRYGSLEYGGIAREPGPQERGSAGFRYREMDGDITKTQLLFGWRAPTILDDAAPALDLASYVLARGRASRLYRAVRERQLAASVSASSYAMAELGLFTIHAEAEPDDTVQAARAAWTEVMRLADETLPASELSRARRLYESGWLRPLETMEGRANHLAAWEALGEWQSGERYFDRLRTQTAEDVRSACAQYLSADEAAVLVYRPRTSRIVAADAAAMRHHLATSATPVPPLIGDAAPPAIRSGTAELETSIGDVHVFRTRAGVPILVRRRRGSSFAYMGAYSRSGASSDTHEKAGLTVLLTRSALKGTTKRGADEISATVETLGGTVASSAGGDSLGWSLAVPLQQFEPAIALIAEIAQEPAFPADAVEVERRIALTDLALLRDDMFAFPVRLMTQAAFGRHPYSIPASGTEDGLRGVSFTDLRAAHASRVLGGSTVIGIVADAEPAQLAGVAARAFDRLSFGALPEISPATWPRASVVFDAREKAQTALAIGLPAPARRDPARYTIEIVARVASGLGGRMFEKLRDKQSLAYTVHCFPMIRPGAGLFGTYIATSPEREDEAREGVYAELRRLVEDPPEGEELARAQEYAVGTDLIRRESGSALLGDMVEAWLFGGLAELDAYESAVRGVTTDAIVRAVTDYLDPAMAAIGVVRGTGREV